MSRSDTRERILEAAERLYAERGVHAVSLREIGVAAGQRNTAVVHYYFGGRDGLVQALFEARFRTLDDRRRAMLAELDAGGRGRDLHALTEVLVLPFAEALGDGSGDWVRFVARLHEDPRYNPFAAVGGQARAPYAAQPDAIAATAEVTRRLGVVAGLHPRQRPLRFFLVTTMVVHAVADRDALLRAGAAEGLPSHASFVRGLVDVSCAVLTAPAAPRAPRVPRRR